MAENDYGAGVSRYLDPENTGFENVVYQDGKFVLDAELNLNQDIQFFKAQEVLRQQAPSGFLTGDFDEDSNSSFDFRAEANAFYLIDRPVVHVNGWVIPLEFTNTTTAEENRITLASPPASAGSIALDFVYLEVWKALVAPDPSTDNKPSATQIWYNGNVLSPAATWITEDMLDPILAAESTRRVQIQWRLKSQRLTNTANKRGYTDANVFAQGPQAALSVFTFDEVDGDPGLWRAGDGDPNNSLGTTDGYVYSIPVCLVYRRNSQAFDFLGNGNGGALLASGSSDRPDGYYSDSVVFDDLQDMRRHVSFTGFDLTHEVERSTSLLMDLNLRTWATNTAYTGFYVGGSELAGSRILKADDLVPSNAVPSDPASGNTFGGADGIRTVFSDRPTAQQHIVVFSPPGGTWNAGDTVTLDLTAITGLGGPLSDEQPTGTVVNDVLDVSLNESAGGAGSGVQTYNYTSISGLGGQTVVITLDDPPTPGSSADLWVTYEVLYPVGAGLKAHVDEAAAGFTTNVHDPTAFNADIGVVFTNDAAGREAIRDYLQVSYEDGPHREVSATYTTDSAVTLTVFAQDTTTVLLPEYLYEGAGGTINGVVSVQGTGGGPLYTVDPSRTSGRQVGIDAGGPLPADDTSVEVTFFPARALPTNGTPITFYYMTPGIQAIQFEYLQNATPNNDLVIKPLAISNKMRVGTTGSGSPLTSFPYEAPMGQIPVHRDAPYDSEAELSAPGPISIDDYDATTGFAELPLLLPMVPVESFTFQDPLNVTTQNAEFLDHFTSVDLTAYRPSAIAQSLSALAEHKVFVSFIGRLEQDTDFGRQGELVLVVVANYLEASSENRVGFADSGNLTCAAVYKLKGNLLVK